MSQIKYRDSKLSPKAYWEKYAKSYEGKLKNEYHNERLSMISRLLANIKFDGKKICDFGCGGGEIDLQLAERGGSIVGIDISQSMVDIAKENFARKNLKGEFVMGGVNQLKELAENSFDTLICFNVLAYLEKDELEIFFRESNRILKNGGELIISNPNELFDMFTLNSFTYSFYNKYLLEKQSEQLKTLLPKFETPQNIEAFKVRFNPLNFSIIMSSYGYEEVQQEFSHYHSLPPLLLPNSDFEPIPDLERKDQWKLMFKCSIYGTRLIKRNTI